MSYNTCTALFSNFKSVSSMTECLKSGNAFAVLGNHRTLFIDTNLKIKDSELEFLDNNEKGDIKLYFLKEDYQKLQQIFTNLCEILNIIPKFNNKLEFHHKKKSANGDIVLGIFLGICVYDIAQDLVLLKNNINGKNKASIELSRYYYNDDEPGDKQDSTFFKNTINHMYLKRAKTLTDAFLKIKDVCDYFYTYTKNHQNIREKYNTAFHNVLIGTYFHGTCNVLDQYSQALTINQTPKKIKKSVQTNGKKLNFVEFFNNEYESYLDINFENFSEKVIKMLFPTQDNFTETFENNIDIRSVVSDDKFKEIRRKMKKLFSETVRLYGFEYDHGAYMLSEDSNIWNDPKQNQDKYLTFLPEMIKSHLFFNHDDAQIFIASLRDINSEHVKEEENYKTLLDRVNRLID